MSQISSRLGAERITALGSYTTLQPAADKAANALRSQGRSYLRRLFATDLILVGTACALPAVANSGPGQNYYLLAGVLLAAAWMISLRSFKTHVLGNVAVGMAEYKSLAYASLAMAGSLGVLIGLTGYGTLRIFLLLSLPIGLATLMSNRWAWRQWLARRRRSGYALSNVLIYGQPSDVPFAVRQISGKSGPAYRVVGVLLDGPADEQAELEIRAADPTLPLAYGGGSLEHQVQALGADSVIVAGPLAGGNEALQHLGWSLESSGTKLIVASSLVGVASRRVRTSPLDGMPLLHVDLAKFSGARYLLKRGFDVLFSAAALLALAPVFLVIAAVIKLEGPGKVFFLQERAGQDGRPFKMFKFRTMVPDAEAKLAQLRERNDGAGPLFKLKHDPRITRCGHWLRKHSLDELPQFLNVLRGEMSVVGPRPPLFTEVAAYEGHAHRRLLLKPGVTGLWQVSGRSNLDWKESVRLDLYYAENWTVLSDARIIWRTFRVMIKPDGAY